MNSKKMFYSKRFFISVLVSGSILLSGCSAVLDALPVVNTKEPVRNSLGGRVGSDGPILAVKIDDTKAARPQVGVEDADLVYIEQVEGGLTRLAAVFSSIIPTMIGPVRSARISDIEILEQFGRVAFAYSGAQRKLLPVISEANLIDLGAQRQPPSIYSNDPLRNPPTAMILQAQALMAKVAESSEEVAISKSVGWEFGDGPDTGTVIDSVKISWPAQSYEATWSQTENRWLLSNSGVPNMSASGLQLGATTFVIQIVSITPSIYGDKFGGVTPFTSTVGSGTGFVLRDGKAIEAIWSRPSPSDGTSWKSTTGESISFAPGQVWIALTDKAPQFSFPSPKSPSSSSQSKK